MNDSERETIIRDEALKAADDDDVLKAAARVVKIIDRHHYLLEQEKMGEFVAWVGPQPKLKSKNAAVLKWPEAQRKTYWWNHYKNSHRNYLTMRVPH